MRAVTHRRYLALFAASFIALSLLFLALKVAFGPLQGDLTRLGGWPEKDYGPRREAEVPAPWKESGPAGASILLLGDSFSAHTPWIPELERRLQFRVAPYQYRRAGCIDNWLSWVSGQTARKVVIEIVERDFLQFGDLKPCAQQAPRQEAGHEPASPPADALYLLRTGFNLVRLALAGESPVRQRQVVNAPLKPGAGDNRCAVFSSRRGDRLLYLAEDERKRAWEPASIARAVAGVRAIHERLSAGGQHLVFVVVPDKSTTYAPCLGIETPGAGIAALLVDAGVAAPDLARAMQPLLAQTPDLYEPNDTHFGPVGYAIMADLVARELAKR